MLADRPDGREPLRNVSLSVLLVVLTGTTLYIVWPGTWLKSRDIAAVIVFLLPSAFVVARLPGFIRRNTRRRSAWSTWRQTVLLEIAGGLGGYFGVVLFLRSMALEPLFSLPLALGAAVLGLWLGGRLGSFDRASRAEWYQPSVESSRTDERVAGVRPALRVTPGQQTFDLFVGAFLPGFCLVLDPIVFREWGSVPYPGVAGWTAPEFAFIGVAVLVLMYWLSCGRAAAFVAGILTVAGIGVLLLGVHLLPLVSLGMFYNPYVGLLGLAPFPAAFVYTRNAFRALVVARATGRFPRRLFLLGALTASVPLFGHVYIWYAVTSAIEEVAADDAPDLSASLSTLRRYSFAQSFHEVMIACQREPRGERRDRVLRLRREIELTGEYNHRYLKRVRW